MIQIYRNKKICSGRKFRENKDVYPNYRFIGPFFKKGGKSLGSRKMSELKNVKLEVLEIYLKYYISKLLYEVLFL